MLELDEPRPHLVLATFSGRLVDADIDRLTRRFAAAFERREPFGLVVTHTDSQMPPLHLLQRSAEWARSHREPMARWCVATGVHISSAIARGAIKFSNSITTPPSPQGVFATLGEALDWVEARLDEAGL